MKVAGGEKQQGATVTGAERVQSEAIRLHHHDEHGYSGKDHGIN